MIILPPFLGLGGPKVAAYTPAYSSLLKVWHDAQQFSAANGDFVENWPDLITGATTVRHGNHCTFQTAALNGLPAMRFGNFGAYPSDSASASLTYSAANPINAIVGTGDFLAAFVARYETLASSGEQASYLAGAAGPSFSIIGYEKNSTMRVRIGSNDGYNVAGPNLPAVYQQNKRFIVRRRGTTVTVAVNGALTAALSPTYNKALDFNFIGNYGNTYARVFIGMLGEIRWYAGDFDDTALGLIDIDLKNHWGL